MKFANTKIKKFCGSKKSGKTFTSPTYKVDLEFTSDDAIVAEGFNISVTRTQSDCNKVLKPPAGETGTISASRRQRACDYKIVAPSGSQVRIDEISAKIRKTANCTMDWLAINGNSEGMYPKERSKVICGWSKDSSPMTSTSGEMYVAYKGSTRSRGFQLKYTIV